MTGPFIVLLALALTPQEPAQAAGPGRDSAAALRRKALRAEWEYERTARVRAPISFAGSAGGPCDEVVGRFCLRFDDPGDRTPPRPEAAPVTRARDEALDLLEAAAAASPADARTARGLVRLLVESRRDSGAVAAAARFARSSPGMWAELLETFALHATGDDTSAEEHFDRAYSLLDDRERRRLRIDKLIAPPEASALKRLSPEGRAAYEAALWKLGDPLYLTAGNEVRGEHLARYIWSRMLAELPVVRGMNSWGDDLEELTFRYGVPTARERVPGRFFDDRDDMVEHYDAAQLPFLPESLLVTGVRRPPYPGDPWSLDDTRARSGYAPATVRRIVSLPVQLTRFYAGDSVLLRVDCALPLDSVARGMRGAGAAEAGNDAALFVLAAPALLLRGDTAPRRILRVTATLERDSILASFALALPPGTYVYSAEVLERGSRLAGRSRYEIDLLPAPSVGPLLSDVVVARPFGSATPRHRDDPLLRPLAEPIASSGDTLGLYAEVSRLGGTQGGSYRVELRLQSAQHLAPPARVLAWLRGRLGGRSGAVAVRASWTGEATAAAPVALATDLVLPRLRPGLYTLHLRVTDGATGAAAESHRLLRVRR